MKSNSRRMVLITGASGGLGSILCAKFLDEGWNVISVARRIENSTSIDERIYHFNCDVADHVQVRTLFSWIENTGFELSAVIHAAAIVDPIGQISDVDEVEWAASIAVNLNGTFYVLKNAVNHFRRHRGGTFIALSGGGASSPLPRFLAYASAKCSIVRLIESVAQELSDENISLCAVAPGVLDTQMTRHVLDSGENIIGQDYFARLNESKMSVDKSHASVQLIYQLAKQVNAKISGRFISAIWDDWQNLIDESKDAIDPNKYVLRRISDNQN